MTTQVLSYGGGRQTAALCLLVEQGRLPRPDRIVIADTGREKPSTWEYLEEVIQPRMTAIGLPVEIAPRSLAYVDLYGHNGDLLLPVYTATGKLSAFCSDEWKASVVNRYLKLTALGYSPAQIAEMPRAAVQEAMKQRTPGYVSWIGFALDERKRIKSREGRLFPLVDLALTKADCRAIVVGAGLPLPPRHPAGCAPICRTQSGAMCVIPTPMPGSRRARWMRRSARRIASRATRACGFTTLASRFVRPLLMRMTAGWRAASAASVCALCRGAYPMKITISLAPGVPFIRASDPAFARLDAAALQAQLQAALASGGDPEAVIYGAIEAARRELRTAKESI